MSRSIQVSLTTNTLHRLLQPVAPLAHRDGDLPAINAVHVERIGDYLTATATDRFRVGVQRVRVEEMPAGEFACLIRLEQVRSILALFKATRRGRPEVTVDLHLEDGRLVVEQHVPGDEFSEMRAAFPTFGATYEPRGHGAGYPDLHGLITRTIAAKTDDAPNHWGISLSLLAGFAQAVKRNGNGYDEALWMHRPKGAKLGPLLLAVGDDFVGMIMPRRLHGETSWGEALETVEGWARFLTDKTTTPSREPSTVEEQGEQLDGAAL